MIYALQRSDKPIPTYLDLLRQEFPPKKQTATFSMYCFWTGEKELGAMSGVLATEAGYMHGQEVVKVTYDPMVVDFKTLLKKGASVQCASEVFTDDSTQWQVAATALGSGKVRKTGDYRPDKENKYYLSHTVYRAVRMTPLQAARANALLAERQSPEGLLSPRQIAQVRAMQKLPPDKWPNLIGKPL